VEKKFFWRERYHPLRGRLQIEKKGVREEKWGKRETKGSPPRKKAVILLLKGKRTLLRRGGLEYLD